MKQLLPLKKITGVNRRIVFVLFVFFQTILLRADSLWVHHIGVGQGDATLIVAWQQRAFPLVGVDTTSILIDAGNSSGKGNAVFTYVNDILGPIKHLNYIITSHLHSDHIGGMPLVLQRLRENTWKVDYIIDRGSTALPLPDICYGEGGPDEDNDPVEPVSLPHSGIYTAYQTECNNAYYAGKRSNIAPGNDLFRALGRGLNMSMMCVVANGCVLQQYNSPLYNCPANPNPDENDFSFGFLLQFDGFKYFTAGDLGGGGHYLDLETPLIPYFRSYPIMDFHFCSYKASHHGSANSNNAAFIDYTEPQFSIIPSALRSFSGTQLPGQSVVERLQDVPGYLAYTYHYTTFPYSGAVSEYYDVKFRISNPGYDQNINIPIYRRSRNKASPYGVTSAYALLNAFTCTKLHYRPDPVPTATSGGLTTGIKSRDLPPRKLKKILRLKRKSRHLTEKANGLMIKK